MARNKKKLFLTWNQFSDDRIGPATIEDIYQTLTEQMAYDMDLGIDASSSEIKEALRDYKLFECIPDKFDVKAALTALRTFWEEVKEEEARMDEKWEKERKEAAYKWADENGYKLVKK